MLGGFLKRRIPETNGEASPRIMCLAPPPPPDNHGLSLNREGADGTSLQSAEAAGEVRLTILVGLPATGPFAVLFGVAFLSAVPEETFHVGGVS